MDCFHEQTVQIDGEKTACCDCGLILDFNLFPRSESHREDQRRQKVSNYLLDLADRGHMQTGAVFDAVEYTIKLLLENQLRGFSIHEIACFAFFTQLMNCEACRSVEEVSYFGGVHPSQVHKIQKKLDQNLEIHPHHLVNRICEELLIPFKYQSVIVDYLSRLNAISSAKPETKLACAVISLVEKECIALDKKMICQHLGIQWPSVRSLIKRAAL